MAEPPDRNTCFWVASHGLLLLVRSLAAIWGDGLMERMAGPEWAAGILILQLIGAASGTVLVVGPWLGRWRVVHRASSAALWCWLFIVLASIAHGNIVPVAIYFVEAFVCLAICVRTLVMNWQK